MFLIERIIGVSIFLLSLIIISHFIGKCSNVIETKKYFIIYLIIIFFMGYFYCQYKTADLDYIKNLINTNLKYKNFYEMIDMVASLRFQIYYFYYWIFGKIGDVNLLPAVTGFWFYANIFYILYKSSTKFNISSKSMSRALLFFMAGGQFLEVISGIKSMLALSIVAVCCFREFVEDKSFILDLPLYLFAALMHDAALIAVGFRLGYLILQKENRTILKARNVAVLLAFAFFAFKYGGEIIAGATSKAQGYISGNVYSNIWEYIIAFFCNLFMIYSMILIKKITKSALNLKKKLHNLTKFIIYLLVFDGIFIFEYSIYQRYRTFIMMLILPIIAILLEKSKNKENPVLSKYYLRFQFFFFFTMGLSLIRGNLSSLKFFEL